MSSHDNRLVVLVPAGDLPIREPMTGCPDAFSPLAVRSRAAAEPEDALALGPLRKVYLIWLAGASCEGCTVAALGGTHPRLEQLLTGAVPGLPRVELVHPLLATESGEDWVRNLVMAERGELDAPYVLTWEGAVPDESTARRGSWSALGHDPDDGRQVTSGEWLDRLVPRASAVIAIGTCASWGGVPAAAGSPTRARGLREHLGRRYRSVAGVPLVTIPGCAPVGDNYVETVAALLLHLNELAPLPELDDDGRPVWLFADAVHRSCTRLAKHDAGVFAAAHGSDACLLELGCRGPVVQCNVPERGVVDGQGGCMSMGGICIGCTMPGFPDRFLPSAALPGPAVPPVAVAPRAPRFVRRAGAPLAPGPKFYRRRSQGSA